MIRVNGDPMEWDEGMTVQDILDRKNFTFRMLSVWIDERAVAARDFKSARIPDGANVQVIHMISGG